MMQVPEGAGLGLAEVGERGRRVFSEAVQHKAVRGRHGRIEDQGHGIRVALLTTVLAAGPTSRATGHVTASLAGYHDAFLTAAAIAPPCSRSRSPLPTTTPAGGQRIVRAKVATTGGRNSG
jgi:hypothetical protein